MAEFQPVENLDYFCYLDNIRTKMAVPKLTLNNKPQSNIRMTAINMEKLTNIQTNQA